MAIKYGEAMSFTDVEKAIGALNKRAVGLKNDVQHCLIAVSLRWLETGDVARAATLFSRIVNEVEGYYGQALVNYLSSYLKLDWKEGNKKENKPGAFKYTETKVEAETIKQMKKEPFWQFSPPPDPKPFEFAKELERLISRAHKRNKEKTNPKDKIDLGLVRRLADAVSQYKIENGMTQGEA